MTTPPTDEQLTEWADFAANKHVGFYLRDAIDALIQEVRRLREECEDSLSRWNQVQETLNERDRYKQAMVEAKGWLHP